MGWACVLCLIAGPSYKYLATNIPGDGGGGQPVTLDAQQVFLRGLLACCFLPTCSPIIAQLGCKYRMAYNVGVTCFTSSAEAPLTYCVLHCALCAGFLEPRAGQAIPAAAASAEQPSVARTPVQSSLTVALTTIGET